MAAVNNTLAPDLFAAYGPKQKSTSEINDTENRFLAVLVAQMNNQDPLNPLDNAQVTSQMAQINTVKGIEQLNRTVEMLVGKANANEQMAALTAVGRQVLVKGESITLYDGQAAAGFELPSDVEKVTVTIRDAAGKILHTADLGNAKAGIHTFIWDGKTDSGQDAVNNVYRFEVEGTAHGQKIDATELAIGRIDGLVPNQQQATFQISGLPPATLADIRQFL